jgi:hypothetical protein
MLNKRATHPAAGEGYGVQARELRSPRLLHVHLVSFGFYSIYSKKNFTQYW